MTLTTSVCQSDKDTIIELGDWWIRNILNKTETKLGKFKEDPSCLL